MPHTSWSRCFCVMSRPGLVTRISSRCHSVGVRRMSCPARVAFLATRSMVKSSVVTLTVSWRERRVLGAADGGPQPGQEFVHAERLGDVVVGPRVQRRHLLVGSPAGGEHQDRYARPAAQGLDDVHAVHVRQAQVEDDHVGLARGGEPERGGAVGRRVHSVPTRLHVDHEGPDELRVVLHHQYPGHRCTPFLLCGGQNSCGTSVMAAGVDDPGCRPVRQLPRAARKAISSWPRVP